MSSIVQFHFQLNAQIVFTQSSNMLWLWTFSGKPRTAHQNCSQTYLHDETYREASTHALKLHLSLWRGCIKQTNASTGGIYISNNDVAVNLRNCAYHFSVLLKNRSELGSSAQWNWFIPKYYRQSMCCNKIHQVNPNWRNLKSDYSCHANIALKASFILCLKLV